MTHGRSEAGGNVGGEMKCDGGLHGRWQAAENMPHAEACRAAGNLCAENINERGAGKFDQDIISA